MGMGCQKESFSKGEIERTVVANAWGCAKAVDAHEQDWPPIGQIHPQPLRFRMVPELMSRKLFNFGQYDRFVWVRLPNKCPQLLVNIRLNLEPTTTSLLCPFHLCAIFARPYP
jgi:hypothetical protein